MARKYHPQTIVKAVASAPVMNLRMAMFNAAGINAPPRAKRVHVPRRRLTVMGFAEPVQAVKIIHLGQNLGSPALEPKPVQEQRV